MVSLGTLMPAFVKSKPSSDGMFDLLFVPSLASLVELNRTLLFFCGCGRSPPALGGLLGLVLDCALGSSDEISLYPSSAVRYSLDMLCNFARNVHPKALCPELVIYVIYEVPQTRDSASLTSAEGRTRVDAFFLTDGRRMCSASPIGERKVLCTPPIRRQSRGKNAEVASYLGQRLRRMTGDMPGIGNSCSTGIQMRLLCLHDRGRGSKRNGSRYEYDTLALSGSLWTLMMSTVDIQYQAKDFTQGRNDHPTTTSLMGDIKVLKKLENARYNWHVSVKAQIGILHMT